MTATAPQQQEALDFGDQLSRRSPAVSPGRTSTDRGLLSPEGKGEAAEVRTRAQSEPNGNAPRPLPDELPPVEPFEVRLLPATLAPWVIDTWERMQCPPDYPAVAAMAAMAGVVGCRVAIGPQAETDWLVVPNLWALLVGRPGLLKSPAMEAMLAPLKTLAQEAAEAFQGALAEHEAALLAHKLRREAAEKAVRQKLARDPTADIGAELLIVPPEAPSQRRFLAGDSSAEALGELLRQNPEGILVHRDEMMSLLRWLDREDNAAARGLYLSAWNGDSSYIHAHPAVMGRTE